MAKSTRPPVADAVLKVPLSMVELAADKQTVCVTGAAGYIAAHILQRLLAAGHTVHAAVRSAHKLGPLTRLPGAAERLKVFEGCDLTVPGSFDAAVQGCDCVMHTASPFALNVKRHLVEKFLLEPAVEGTRTVLASVEKAPSVKRVVLTSSIVALFSWPVPGTVYDETFWNNQASEDEYAYELSKTLAEKAAWDIAGKQDRWDLVAINPALVFGPPLLEDHTDAQSVHVMRRMLRGDMAAGYPDYYLKMVDVRDVARAHCLAMVVPSASGRYLLAPYDFTFGRVRDVIARAPLGRRWNVWLRLPAKPLWRWLLWLIADLINIERYRLESTYGVRLRTNGTKVERELGLRDWIPDADTYEEMAETMIALGMINWLPPSVAGPNAIVPFPPTKRRPVTLLW